MKWRGSLDSKGQVLDVTMKTVAGSCREQERARRWVDGSTEFTRKLVLGAQVPHRIHGRAQ